MTSLSFQSIITVTLVTNEVFNRLIILLLMSITQVLKLTFQAGLSGSSAIVCAALNCLLDFYEVRHLIKVETRPSLILSAENELGIVAGLQDRVAQVYEGLVYMVSCPILRQIIHFM